MRRLLTYFGLGLFVFASACGGGSASSGGSGLGSGTQSITGTVLAPNGTDPVAGATISIPSSSTSISLPASLPASANGTAKTVSVTCSGATVTCSDPASTALVSTCSCADGTFSLDVSGLTTSQRSAASTLNIEKGDLSKSVSLSCTDSACTIAATDTTLPSTGTGALSIAVVTGQYDDIQDVLAKLGFGDLDSTTNKLDVGTEDFTIFRGGDSELDAELAAISTDTYKTSTQLFSDLTLMNTFDIIFINCGADELSTLSASVSDTTQSLKHVSHEEYHAMMQKSLGAKSTLDSTLISNLQSYVNAGGKLYVTDLAFNYIEQPFPEVMDFAGNSDEDSTTAESNDFETEIGTSGIVSDATVSNATMKTWLSGRTSNTINDTSNSPNLGFCDTTAGGNSTSLNSDGTTIRIGDFLSGWAVMENAYDSTTTVWLEGPVTFSAQSTAVTRPLTITRAIGSNGGEVLYSSYHSAHSCATSGFWPQERVLQYLVFEVAE